MSTEEQRWRLDQLTEQQGAITRAINAVTEGRWTGSDSLEAWLVALSPPLAGQLSPRPPLYERPPPPLEEIGQPHIRWIGSPNHWPGRAAETVCAIVIHTMAGSLAGSDSWLQNPAAQVSYHFGIGLRGQQHQYVHLSDSSWANGILETGHTWPCGPASPNRQTVSIGTEDLGSAAQPVTDEQFRATLEVANLALRTFPSICWLLGHHDISPRTRPSCPGNRWRQSGRFAELAARLNLQTRS